MADGTPPLVFVDLYQTEDATGLAKLLQRTRPQRWRWRALNGSNFRVLAVSSESYTNRSDAISAIYQLFGFGTNAYLRQHEVGDVPLRMANPNPTS